MDFKKSTIFHEPFLLNYLYGYNDASSYMNHENDVFFLIFIMILIQKEVAPKRYNLCSRRWTLVS